MTTVLTTPQPLPKYNVSLVQMLRNRFRFDVLQVIESGWRSAGDLYTLQLPFQLLTLVSNPEYAREVMINQHETFLKPSASPRGDLLEDVLGVGLITNSDRDSWFTNRRMMQPMFHRRRLASMASKMIESGDRMLARWQQAATAAGGSVVLDMSQEMMLVTMDIVMQVMFSADIRGQSHSVGDAVSEALDIAFDRRLPLRAPLSWPTPTNQRYKQALATIDNLIYGLIDTRRGHEAEYDDLLSMLLEARDEDTGTGMSRVELRNEAAGIFGAGHETTSHTLSWTLDALSKHPQVCANLREEIDGVLQGKSPTPADLPQLPYARMVIEESMRLMPVIPLVPRYASRPAVIGAYQVPVSDALICIWNIHRHPDYWQEPEAFRPERMAESQKKGRHRLAWMPFGAGQRMCIGNSMALMESHLLLVQMMQHFTFESADDCVESQLAVALRPKNGIKMHLTPRK